MLRTRECTSCGTVLDPKLHGDCGCCSFAVLCDPCASRHYCSGQACIEFGCFPGQCIRIVEDGVTHRKLGPKGARERWGPRRRIA